MRISFFFLIIIFNCSAQNIASENVSSNSYNYDVFWGNDLSGCHYFSKSNNLFKVSKTDTLNYANNNFGKISSVETFNMLQTLIFYKENNAFVLLDAQFNEINSGIFSEINCEFLKPASQNEFWFYDNFTQQIGLYHLNTKKINFLSNPIKSLSYSQSDYNYLYWVDAENECFSISKFGKISRLGKLHPYDKLFFLNQHDVFYLFDTKIYYYTFENQIVRCLEIKENLIKNFSYSDGFFSIFTNNQLNTYKIKK
jgi:hypothetical protein